MFMLEREYREEGLPPSRLVSDGTLQALHILYPELDEGRAKRPGNPQAKRRSRSRTVLPPWRRLVVKSA